MADTEDDFDKAFEGFGEDDAPVTPPVEPPKDDSKPVEEPKKDEEPAKKPEEIIPPTDAPKEEEGIEPPKAPEAPPAPDEAPQPLTKDDVTAIITNLRNDERNSGKELETTAKEVLDAYYPDGLSNTLVDEASGKELRSPQDVVDASGGQMSTEEAAQWLINEQFKLDNQVAKIKSDAQQIAETTVNFKRDSMTVLEKYEPLFKAYPQLQKKVYDKLMKQVKVDEKHGVILSAPDVMEHYDDYLEPYQQAYEFSNKGPATNPTPPATPPAPTPTAEDRMDISGDGGQAPVDDPNDFAQQVSKELAKGI